MNFTQLVLGNPGVSGNYMHWSDIGILVVVLIIVIVIFWNAQRGWSLIQ
jgi:hypothetical protein